MLSSHQIQILTDGIQEASDIVMGFYGKNNLGIIQKPDDSPVTEADFASNNYLTGLLNREFPGTPVISEENPQPSWEERKNWDYFWILDPLDGTREFISRNDEFAINLALIYKNSPVFGLISIPAKGLIYSAVKGGGSWLHRAGEPPIRLPFQNSHDQNMERIVLISRSHAGIAEEAYISFLRDKGFIPRIQPAGSSYKHVLLAEGSAHLYPKLGICWEWDTAPGQIILEEAGGKVIRTSDMQPLSYNKESFRNPDFIMWAPGVTPVHPQNSADTGNAQ